MTSRPTVKRKKKERTWAEAATIALSNFPPRAVTTKEIMNYIYEHKLKDIKHTKASENVLKTMLCHHAALADCPFYKIKGKNGFYKLKTPLLSSKVDELCENDTNEVEPSDDSMVTRGRASSTVGTKNRNLTPLDLETPNSALTNTKIKAVINSTTFSVFPPAYQHLLINFLPSVDRITNPDHTTAMSQTALNNEFFSQALQEWFNRLCEGEFTRETQARIMQEVAKERNKIDPWKINFFEEYYGQRSGETSRRRSVDMTADLPDLSFDAQVAKFEHLRKKVEDVAPVFGKHDVKSPMTQFCDLSSKSIADETVTSTKVHSTLYRHPTGCESPLYEDDYSSEEETVDEYHEEIEDEDESDTSVEDTPTKKRKRSHDDDDTPTKMVALPIQPIQHVSIATPLPPQTKSPVIKPMVKRTRTLAEIKAQMKARRAAAQSTRYVPTNIPTNSYEDTPKYIPCEMEYTPQCDTQAIPQYTPSNAMAQESLSEPAPVENSSPTNNGQKIVLKLKAVTGDKYSVKLPAVEAKSEPSSDVKVSLLSVSPAVFGEAPFTVGTQIPTTHNKLPSDVQPFTMKSAPVGFEDITPKGDAKATPQVMIKPRSNSFTQQQTSLPRVKFRSASAGKSLLQMQELAKKTQMLSSESEIAESESENDESPSSPDSNAESSPIKVEAKAEIVNEMINDDDELTTEDVILKCLCRCKKLVLCKGCGAYTHQECLTPAKLCSLCV